MHRLCGPVLVALIAGACAATPSAAPSSAPTAVPTALPSATAPGSAGPTVDPTPRVTPTPVPAAGICPTSTEITVRQFVDAELDCFFGQELTMRAWLDFSPPLGWEGPGIEPSWVAYPPGGGPAALWQAPPRGEENMCDAQLDLGCAWFFAHVDPASNIVLGNKRWVVITGHVPDPAAATCHYVPYDGMDEPLPDAALAVEYCRGQFVVTSIKSTDAPA